ncbi:MAG: hypothetical protein GY862_00225 [Gammaproteobacteria bacterium]|nr:hypothetical protein [Gammaproteobacteria bacterium]
MENWQALKAGPVSAGKNTPGCPGLAERLTRGDMVLFLGSEILPLFDSGIPAPESISATLAENAQYVCFSAFWLAQCYTSRG